MSEYHAGVRFDEGCAALLRGIARRMAGARRPDDAEMERANAATRASLGRLALLAGSADLEARWWRRAPRADTSSRGYRDKARLAARVFQDAVVLDRVVRQAKGAQADVFWQDAVRAAGTAVADVADALAGKGTPDLTALTRVASLQAMQAAQATPSRVLLAAPLCLLLDDLQRLQHCIASAAAVA